MSIDNLLSGLIGAVIGAIIGAIGGGIAVYWASIALERRKIHEKICRLHALLMLEITGNQARLVNSIDRILPAWLRRGEFFAGR